MTDEQECEIQSNYIPNMFVRFYIIHLKQLLIRFDVLKVLLCRPRVTKHMKNDLRGLRGRCAQLEEQLREYFRYRKQIVGKYVIDYVDLATHLCCVIS